jgi:NlpC/P60 family
MAQCLKNLVLLGSCLTFLAVVTPQESAAQEMQAQITKFTAGLEYPDLPGELPDAKSLLLMLGAQIHDTDLDCSHFVQYLYEQAGLYYGYAPSRVLYAGMEPFKRVRFPEAGDLIVWQGHVGIVIDPEEATFLSALSSGVKITSYRSTYWKRRGRPHFLRYAGVGSDVHTLAAQTEKSVSSRAARSSATAE